MELVSLSLNEAAIRAFASSLHGPLADDLRERAERVTAATTTKASGRPGPNIRSGDLHSSIRFQIGADSEGIFADIGSDAQHRGFDYPSWLQRETTYHWLPVGQELDALVAS